MRILLLIFALLGVALSSALAQSPDSSEKSPGAPATGAAQSAPGDEVKPESTTADAAREEDAPEVNPAHEMLQQAYYAGGQLAADEHAYQMGRLVIVAARMRHPMLRQWVHEVFQLTAGLPQQRSARALTEQGALSALAEVDPTEALQMLGQMPPVAITSTQFGNGQSLDPRTSAARNVFQKYLKLQEPDLNAVRGVANYLGETGLYPFGAVGQIIRAVSAKDEAVADGLFLDAMQYYQRKQINSSQVHVEFASLLETAKGIVPDSMERAAVETMVDKLLRDAAEPLPSDTLLVARNYTSTGYFEPRSMPEQILFRVLPLVRELAPDLEERIREQRAHLINPAPTDLGPWADGYRYTHFLFGIAPGERESKTAEIINNSRAETAKRFAATNMEAAINFANTITDPNLKAATLLEIAPDKAKGESQSANSQQAQAQPKQPPDDKTQLAAYLTTARMQARQEGAPLWDTISRGLNFAEELFVKASKAGELQAGYMVLPDWEGPVYDAPGFREAHTLVLIGVQKETANTLGWLAQQRNPLLKSFLLISAAEGLWNKQQAAADSPGVQDSSRQTSIGIR
jgi:hypothetical protein